ncbi:MAG: DUF1822 family protein [Phormidesmis sp.]
MIHSSFPTLSPFSFALPEAAHAEAAALSEAYPSDSDNADAIYLSSLAAYAARYYLQLCSYTVEPSDPQSQSLDFVHFALSGGMNVNIIGYGQLGCLVVPHGADTIALPLVTSPLGYMAISFSNDLSETSILGFIAQCSQLSERLSVFVQDIQPIVDLPTYLSQARPISDSVNRLSQWWNRSFDRGWTLISERVGEQNAGPDQPFQIAFRTRSGATTSAIMNGLDDDSARSPEETPEDGIVSQKRLTLTNTGTTLSLILMMEKLSRRNSPINIVARLSPDLGQPYLPEAIELIAADDASVVFSSIRSRGRSPFIDLRFSADSGDYFTLKVVLEGISIVESFVV